MINSFSTRKINACLEMIQREKKLTEYANSLILKQQSLKSKKNFYTKKSFSIIQVIDEEIENLNHRLQDIDKEKSRLIKKKQELQNEHESLISIIEKSAFALDKIKQQEMGKESFFRKSRTLSTIEDINGKLREKIEKKKNQIEEMNNSIISLNTSIMKLKIAVKNLQIDYQSVNAKIFSAQARLNKSQNEINDFKEETQKKQDNILNRTMNLKEEEADLNNLRNTAQIHCDSLKEQIKADKLILIEVKKSIDMKKNDILLNDNQIKGMRTQITDLKERKNEILKNSINQSIQVKKSSTKIIELNKEIESISQQSSQIQSQLNRESNELDQMQEDIRKNIPLIEECIQYYNKISDAFITEEALDNLYKETNNKNNQKLPDFNEHPEIKAKRFQTQQIMKSLNNEIVLENDSKNQLIQNIQQAQNKNLQYQEKILGIEEKIKLAKTFDDPLLLSLNSQPNIENVTTLVQSLKTKREKRIERKTRDNETLQKRYNELIKRISIRKRKMKRQISTIENERDELDILPDEEKIVFKSIESLLQIASNEMPTWNKEESLDNERMLNSWENQIESLYDKLDEFLIRK